MSLTLFQSSIKKEPDLFFFCFKTCSLWHFVAVVIAVSFSRLPGSGICYVACLCCASAFSFSLPERDLAVPAMSLKWPGALQHSHFLEMAGYSMKTDGRKLSFAQGQIPPTLTKPDWGAFVPPFPPTLEYLETGMLFPGLASPGNVSTPYTWKNPSLEREAVILLCLQKGGLHNMVDPDEEKKWRSAFPPLWKDVLCMLDTGTEADIVWHSSLWAAEDRGTTVPSFALPRKW